MHNDEHFFCPQEISISWYQWRRNMARWRSTATCSVVPSCSECSILPPNIWLAISPTETSTASNWFPSISPYLSCCCPSCPWCAIMGWSISLWSYFFAIVVINTLTSFSMWLKNNWDFVIMCILSLWLSLIAFPNHVVICWVNRSNTIFFLLITKYVESI